MRRGLNLFVFAATLLLVSTHAQEEDEEDIDLNTVNGGEEKLEYGAPPEPESLAGEGGEEVNFYGYENEETAAEEIYFEDDEGEYEFIDELYEGEYAGENDEFAGEYDEFAEEYEEEGYYISAGEFDEYGEPIYYDDNEAEGYLGSVGEGEVEEEENLFGDYTASHRETEHVNTWTETATPTVHDGDYNEETLFGESADEVAYSFEGVVDPALIDFTEEAYLDDITTHKHSGGLDYDENENTPIAVDAMFNPHHIHDPDTCEDCQAEALEDVDMGIEMIGLALFGAVLFVMWYMLRSCKDKKKGDETFDASNPQSRGRYRPAQLSPYTAADDEIPQVELGDLEQNY